MYITAFATNPVQPDDLETVVGESDSDHDHLVVASVNGRSHNNTSLIV